LVRTPTEPWNRFISIGRPEQNHRSCYPDSTTRKVSSGKKGRGFRLNTDRVKNDDVASLVQAIPSPLIILDRNGKITHINDPGRQLLGDHVAMVGKSWEDLELSSEINLLFQTSLRGVLETNMDITETLNIALPNGGKPYRVDVRLLKGVQPEQIMVLITDVSEEALVEKKLSDITSSFTDTVKWMPSGLLIFQYAPPNKLFLLYSNPSARRMLHQNMDGTAGKEWDEFWMKKNPAGKELFLRVMRDENWIINNVSYFSNPVASGVFDYRAFRMPDNRLCIIFEDVTQAQRERSVREKAIAQIEENIEHFATLIDEIRNPLFVIEETAMMVRDTPCKDILVQTQRIEAILKEFDNGWLDSEKVRVLLQNRG
jgi:nitrogen-specific signal transduction histidine kinase